jgi:hypothetical protein
MRHHKRRVLAGHVSLLLSRMARPTQRGHFIGSRHAIGRRFALRCPMLHASTMTRVTTQTLFKMRMSFEIRHLLLMAGYAKLMRLLPEQRQGQE